MLDRVQAFARQRPVLFVVMVALAVRILAAVVLTATVGMEKFPDTDGYDQLAADRVSGAYHDWDFPAEYYWRWYSGYMFPLSLLYRLFGTHLFWGQLLAAVLGAVAAAAICRLLLEVTSRGWALFGGLIIALFPSQVLWSSVAYKDSSVWAATALLALVACLGARARGWKLAGYGGVLVALLFWLGHLRRPTLIVAAWALVIAAIFSAPVGRIVRVIGAAVILALVPAYLGLGPGGVDYAQAISPSEVRAEGAEDADTAFVDEDDSDGDNELAHLPRGLSVILLEPFPWTSFGGYEVRIAQAELLVWYPLLIVGAFGIGTAVRRRRELAFLLATGAGVLGVYALYEGNFGTAYRHRAELVAVFAVLAALGAPHLLALTRRRSAPPQPVEEQAAEERI